MGEFEERIESTIYPPNMKREFWKLIEGAKKEFPFASWLEEDLEELKMTIKRSIKERGHSVLDDEVSEEFIKTLDAIEKWFGPE